MQYPKGKLYPLPEKLRAYLKRPLGTLVSHQDLPTKITPLLHGDDLIVTVGDATTETLLTLGLIPSVQVVDGLEMRAKRAHPERAHRVEIKAPNPAGNLSEGSIKAAGAALSSEKPVRIVVEGEEDLLALLFIAFYPLGTKVVYGQPREGIVVVDVNLESREMARSILSKMGVPIMEAEAKFTDPGFTPRSPPKG